MKKTSEVIIFLGFVLWVELVGAVVYRTLINDNYSPKEDGGPESNSFNGEKTAKEIEEFDKQIGKIDEAAAQNGMIEKGDEEQGFSEKSDVEQDDSEEKAENEAGVGESGKQDSLSNAIENAAVLIGKGLCTCTNQEREDGEDGQGNISGGIDQETQTKKDDLEDGTEGSGGPGDIDDESHSQNEAENEDAKSEQFEDAETTSSASAEQGRISQESGLETTTEKEENGEQAEMDTKGGNNEQIFRFSPLNR